MFVGKFRVFIFCSFVLVSDVVTEDSSGLALLVRVVLVRVVKVTLSFNLGIVFRYILRDRGVFNIFL